MILRNYAFVALLFLIFSIQISAQNTAQAMPATAGIKKSTAVVSSPAYAELLLRTVERESELEELLIDYKEEFPKVQELRYELNLLKKDADKLAAVKLAESGKLTLALGKLMVRKIEIEVDLWNLKKKYNDDQAEVQRTKRRVEVFQNAIREILP